MKKSSGGLVIDGFVQPNSSHSKKIPRITESSNLSKKPQAVKARLKSTAQSVHKRAQRSQTLMRTAVAKPQKSPVTAKKAAVKPQQTTINTSRSTRVQSITRNSNVRRFGHVFPSAKSSQQPKSTAKHEAAGRPSLVNKNLSSKAVAAKPVPSMITSASHNQLERLLDEALTKADAHKKALSGRLPNRSLWQKIKGAPKWMSIGAGVFIMSILAGFYAWNNVPQVAVKIASTRADVRAEIPSYTPAGFSFVGPVSYSSGSVDIKYKASTDDNKTYTLTQKKSSLSNKSLEDTVVPKGAQVQTSEVAGTKVYIFGPNNDAAWVNNGVQYTLRGSSSLNPDQVLKIAGSL